MLMELFFLVPFENHLNTFGNAACNSDVGCQANQCKEQPKESHTRLLRSTAFNPVCAVLCDITRFCSPMQFATSQCKSVRSGLLTWKGLSLLDLLPRPTPSHSASFHPTLSNCTEKTKRKPVCQVCQLRAS